MGRFGTRVGRTLVLVSALFAVTLVAMPATAATTCVDDGAGDVIDFNSRESVDDARADLVRQCVSFGPTLSLSATPAQPTDPTADPNWRGATFVGWFLDVDGDGEGEYFVDYSLDRAATLRARVVDIRGEDEVQTCVATASHAEGFEVSGIEPGCIGGATEVQVSLGFFYDTEPSQGDDGRVLVDTSPDDGDFEAPASRTPRRGVGRLAGSDRFGTAVEISEHRFPAGAPVAYLARSHVFADAVAGGALTDGPILLVPTCGEPPAIVRSEINRLGPERVIALGGEAAVCSATLDAVAGDRPTGRLAGPTRFHTAVKISQRAFPASAPVVHVARADVLVDAVVSGVLTNGPVLLVPSCGEVPQVVRDEIARMDPDRVVAIGGRGAVCDATLQAAAAGRAAGRLAGPDRQATAIAVSRAAFPGRAVVAYLARDDVFADAVAGGVLSDGPILLVPPCGPVPPPVADEISRLAADKVIALGGTAAVCDRLLDAARDA